MQSLKNKALSALRSSERLFKIDMVYLTKGGFWTTLSFAIGILGSLATTIAFGNLLPREAYGIYSYLISLAGSLMFLTLSGIGPAVIRSVARGIENIASYAFRMHLRYNMLAVATIGLVALYYMYKGNHVFGISLGLLAVAYPVSEALHIYKHILTGKKRFDTLTKIGSLVTLSSTLATIIALLLTDNVVIIISVFALMILMSNLAAYRWSLGWLDRSAPSDEAVGELRRTALHITGAGIIGTIAAYIDKIILFQVAGPATLAIYGFAIAGPDRLKGLIKNWLSISLPKLAESTLGEIRRVFYQRIGLSLLVGGAMAIVYIIFAPYLFQWFLPKYLDSIIYSRVYALSLVLVPATIYIGGIFSSQNMLRAVYAQSVGSQVARIALYVVLAWQWQIWGLVVAAVIFNAANVIYSILVWEIEMRRLMNKNEQ